MKTYFIENKYSGVLLDSIDIHSSDNEERDKLFAYNRFMERTNTERADFIPDDISITEYVEVDFENIIDLHLLVYDEEKDSWYYRDDYNDDDEEFSFPVWVKKSDYEST